MEKSQKLRRCGIRQGFEYLPDEAPVMTATLFSRRPGILGSVRVIRRETKPESVVERDKLRAFIVVVSS
jgi:hypothetical protein